MNTGFTLSWYALLLLGSLVCMRVFAQSTGCVITEDSCPCSQSIPSGSCMKNQGGGKCLLGLCAASYRCDCLGYQMCKRSSCSVYTAMEGTIPSETIPFGCHLSAGAGSCTTFDHMIDTVEAALNAKVDASNSNNEAVISSVEAQGQVTEVHADDLVVNDQLLTIDSIRDQMTPEEEDKIYKNAKIVKDSVTKVARDALNINIQASEAYDSSMKATDMARKAVQAEKDGKVLENRLEEESGKGKKENRECSTCKKLEEDIEKLKQLRKEAAVNAGNSAKSAAKNKDTTARILDEIRETRMNSGLARGRVLSEIGKVKKRLGLS